MMPSSEEARLRDMVLAVLEEIRSTGDPHRRHSFFAWPRGSRPAHPGILSGGIGLEWYIADRRPLLGLVAYLHQQAPALRDRVSVEASASRILDILIEHALDCFDFSFFTDRSGVGSLASSLRPGALEVLCSAVMQWASASEFVLGLVRFS
jgi:hypothetical protein